MLCWPKWPPWNADLPMSKNVDTLYHLTPLQHGMLHHSLLDRTSGVYVEQFSCVLTGPLDPERFGRAWAAVANRHDVLRTLFIRLQEERPVQVVRKQVEVPMRLENWQELPDAAQRQRFDAFLKQDRIQGFNLSEAPLMRLMLADLGGERRRLLWTYHHAILDGWSMPIVLGDVFRHYQADRAAPLPPPLLDYRHYVAWLRKQDIAQTLPFWTEALQGYRHALTFAPSVLPVKDEAPVPVRRLATVDGTPGAVWTEAAVRVCRAGKITLNTLCQGAWALLLGRYADRDDVVHGLVVSGRPQDLPGAEAVAGLFINTLPLRVRLPGGEALMPWLREVQSRTQQIEQRAHSPLAEVLQCAQVPRQQALFDALYVFENYPGQAAFGAAAQSLGLSIDDVRAVEETNYALALIVLPGEALSLHVTYDTARFSAEAIDRLVAQYLSLLARMVEQPDQSLSEIGLDEAPNAEPLPGLVDRDAPTLCELMARHARPDALALEVGGVPLRHGQLQARVAAMLGQWRVLGWRPGDRALLSADTDDDALVLLLSGLAYGIDCVVPDTVCPLDEVLQAGGQAFPEGRPWSVMDGRTPAGVTRGSEGHLEAEPLRGGCTRLSRDASGRWTWLRHDHLQLAKAVGWFMAACPPARDDHRVAVTGSVLSGQNLWTALMALGAGMTVRAVPAEGVAQFLQCIADSDVAWHCVRLDGAQTRELAGVVPPAGLRVTHWAVDARGLTASGAKVLDAACPTATVLREWRWPALSLPHAVSVPRPGVPGLSERGLAAAGTVLSVVDHRRQPVAVDARGSLSVAGDTVPSLWWRQGDAQPAGLASVASDIEAWVQPDGCRAILLQPGAALEVRHSRWRHGEQQFGALPGVRGVAIVETLSSLAEWQAVAFCELDDHARPDELLIRLEALCLAQGLPAPVLRQVQVLPRHAWGIDREALLRGDVVAVRSGIFIGPRDELESALHGIWCELLKLDRIAMDDNYFELGGQSLLAAVMLFQIEEKLSLQVSMEALVSAPTIGQLAEAIRTGRAMAAAGMPDLAAKAVLADDIVPTRDAVREGPVRDAFLTGATGFLGVHLLVDLLEHTQARVHCLVRAANAQAGLDRLEAALNAHGLWRPEYAARIVAVPGELDKPLLGLSEQDFDVLAASVDVIYHNGAMVNFVYPYGMLEQTNVKATQDILRLACLHATKPVHYVSTVGVLDRTAAAMPEALAVPLHPHLNSGYEQSKWVAEQLLNLAAQRGVPVTVYRPSRIVGHSRSGRLNQDDLFCRMIKGMVLLGKAPRDTGFDNMLPVDLVSRIIVEASMDARARGQAVHVVNPRWHEMDALVNFIESRGYPLERMDYQQWLDQLTIHVKQHTDHPLAMLIPVLHVLNPMADPTVGRLLPIEHGNMSQWAERALADGLRPLATWLGTYLDHLQSVGYLPDPQAAAG